jgi:hypothetical protein
MGGTLVAVAQSSVEAEDRRDPIEGGVLGFHSQGDDPPRFFRPYLAKAKRKERCLDESLIRTRRKSMLTEVGLPAPSSLPITFMRRPEAHVTL